MGGDRPGGQPLGLGEQAQHQVLGRISALPAARASFCAPTTTLRARGVNRLKPWLGSRSDGSPGSLGTKRFCAACLVTPMLRPISVHDAPERRAWSTKWPIRWSATSPRWSAAITALDSWSSASGCTFLIVSMRSSRRIGAGNGNGLGHASTIG